VKMDEIVIDGSHAVAGRLAAYAANKLLTGRKVTVLNAEKVVISGNRLKIVKRYMEKRGIQLKGDPDKSPKTPRRPDLLLKRIIYGMLPSGRRNAREAAMHNLRCYMAVPKEYEAAKAEKPVKTSANLHRSFVTLEQVARDMGWKR